MYTEEELPNPYSPQPEEPLTQKHVTDSGLPIAAFISAANERDACIGKLRAKLGEVEAADEPTQRALEEEEFRRMEARAVAELGVDCTSPYSARMTPAELHTAVLPIAIRHAKAASLWEQIQTAFRS
jgi:hypothetical protein